jgi:hypothetical protein
LLRGLNLLLSRRRLGKTPIGGASRCLGKRKKQYSNDRKRSDEAIHATLDCGLLGVRQLKHSRRRQGSLPFFNGAFFGLAR